MPDLFGLLISAASYFLSLYALCLISWTIAGHLLPAGTRVGLRLAVVVVGEFALNAVVVQTLGLAGQLRTGPYLALCLGAGIVVSWRFRERKPHRTLWRCVRQAVGLWVGKMPLGLGWVAAGCLLFLTHRSSLVEGMDSLCLQGPLITSWLQAEKIRLLWHWNYPLCWEYQFASNFLLLRSDLLVVLPRLLQSLALILLMREVGSRLRLPGVISHLTAWLCMLSPLVWGSFGEGSLKNDGTFAVGLLLSLLALERVWRKRPGGFWMIQLGSFTLLGTKPTGVVYAGLFLAATFLASWFRSAIEPRGSRWRAIAWQLGATVLVQATPTAVQVVNFIQNGNPFHPMGVKLGEWVLFPGNLRYLGNTILDHRHQLDTWVQLLRGGAQRVGLEFPILGIVALLATLHIGSRCVGTLLRRRPPSGQQVLFLTLAFATGLFWILFAATPWSAGPNPESLQYLTQGLSLRYAIAPLGLTYLLSATYLSRALGRRKTLGGVYLVFLPLLYHKWRPSLELWYGRIGVDTFLWRFGLALLLAVVAYFSWRWVKETLSPAIRRSEILGGIAIATGWMLLIPIFVARVEGRREAEWGEAYGLSASYRPIWEYVRKEVPEGSVIAVNVDREQPLFLYYLLGARLNNRIREVPDPLAAGRVEVPEGVRFYYLSYRPETLENLPKAVAIMQRHGWRQVAAAKLGVLLVRSDLPAELSARNVIVIVVDALRADHLGCYGYHRATSPFLDQLAAQGILIEGALANSSFTQESVAALLSGLFPSRSGSVGWETAPADELLTLGELYARMGYRTGFFSNTPVLRNPLFAQGFEVVEILAERWDRSGAGPQLSRRAAEFAREHRDQRFLMYLHYLDPHGPYQPADPFYHRFASARFPNPIGLYSQVRHRCHELLAEGFGPGEPRFEDMMLRYDAEIAAVDRAIEQLFQDLEVAGLLDETLVVVTSDHGEEFLEHGYVEHSWTLYAEMLRVPLIFWTPGIRPGRIAARVSLVDLLPTFLELSAIPYPAEQFDGRALFRRQGGAFTFAWEPRRYVGELLIRNRNVLRSMIRGRWKYIAAWKWLPPEERPAALAGPPPPPIDVWGVPVREELYDLDRDPAELRDLAAERPKIIAEFRVALEDYRVSCSAAPSVRPAAPELSEEDEEALRGLGYIH